MLARLLLLLLLMPGVLAYQPHAPMTLKDIHATAEQPHIIEGYEITNPDGDCLRITNSEHIIIRNNHFHDCASDKGYQERIDHYSEGYAVIIGDSEDIRFENNLLEDNYRGFIAYSTQRLQALNNTVTGTIQYSPLWCERCDRSEFAYNHLEDNGNPAHFWVPGDRSIGIWVKRSDDVEIHHNTVIRSTSDGIAVTGQIYGPSFTVPETRGKSPRDDYSGYATNIRIHDNLLLDNMEQGVWLVNARDVKVFNNTIRTGCFTHGASIATEFNVADSEFYGNRFLTCASGPVGGANSYNISVHGNAYYSYDGGKGEFIQFMNDEEKSMRDEVRRGAPYEESHSNTEHDNVWLVLDGALSEEMREKRRYAEEEKTYEAKGWFVCENGDGTVDEACRQREEAKGNQGVPRELLRYSSLMEDFDVYVKENLVERLFGKEPGPDIPEPPEEQTTRDEGRITDKFACEACDHTMEKVYAVLFFVTLALLLLCLFRRRRG